MAWKAEGEDKEYVGLIMSMSTDALLGRGVDCRETFLTNLESMIKTWRDKGPGKPYIPPVRKDHSEWGGG